MDMGSAKEEWHEIWPESSVDAKGGYIIILLSALMFYLSGLLSSRLNPSAAINAHWRWKNISISFVHSLISGPWAALCFYKTPKMAEDLITTYSSFSYVLISVSVGYFLYDMLDMIVCHRTWQSLELVGHHIVVIACYMVAVTTKLYVGYAVVGLLVELNSIFLHLRQLMQIYGLAKTSACYRFNSLLNLGTFIVFRILLLAWMTRWIVINRDFVPLIFYSLGSVGLAIMTMMNIILFYRILRSDFFHRKDKVSKT